MVVNRLPTLSGRKKKRRNRRIECLVRKRLEEVSEGRAGRRQYSPRASNAAP
jgi:hypothetical protein